MKLLKNNITQFGILIAVILVIAYYIGTRTGKAGALNQADAQLQKEISKQPLTYEQSTYESMADKLETAFYGFTNDTEAINSVFSRLRTKSDVLQLISTFGLRRRIWTWGGSNLVQFVNARLTDSEVSDINNILTRNNIDYQF